MEQPPPAASSRSRQASVGAVAAAQRIVEDELTTEQLYLLWILRRKPASEATVSLREHGDDSPTSSLPPPRWQRKQGEIIPIFTGSDRPSSLLGELSPNLSPAASIHHGQQAWAAVDEHPTQLASAGWELHNGITPDSTKGKTNLNQTLQLLFTGDVRAPPPSRLRPAAPTEKIRARAGPRCFAATLNGGDLLENGWFTPCSRKCAFNLHLLG